MNERAELRSRAQDWQVDLNCLPATDLSSGGNILTSAYFPASATVVLVQLHWYFCRAGQVSLCLSLFPFKFDWYLQALT